MKIKVLRTSRHGGARAVSLGMCDRNATVRIPRCARWCAVLRYLAEKQGVTAPARMHGKCIARDTDRAFPRQTPMATPGSTNSSPRQTPGLSVFGAHRSL